jgi:hypothetical protein
MTTENATREQYYRAAMDWLEVAERKRNWKLFGDIAWEKNRPSKNSAAKATCVVSRHFDLRRGSFSLIQKLRSRHLDLNASLCVGSGAHGVPSTPTWGVPR